jgi:Fur family transcriptional regulator, ferric uptake regulator
LARNSNQMTLQREAILRAIKRTDIHPTVEELWAMVRKELPRISLATVYRNLELMANLGLVRRIGVGGDRRRYDGDMSDHHHVRCLECGAVGDIFVDLGSRISSRISSSTSFQIRTLHVEALGICPGCKGKRGEDEKPRHARK